MPNVHLFWLTGNACCKLSSDIITNKVVKLKFQYFVHSKERYLLRDSVDKNSEF